MVGMKKYGTLLLVLIALITGCSEQNESKEEESYNSGKDGWLSGSEADKFDMIANQLRGFDMAMVETGYRYQELYWAGQDQNWEYAQYQLEKIEKTIKNGLERRPKRAESAQNFLNVTVPEMKEAILKNDSLIFDQSFKLLTNSCNSCHAMEEVPFFTVNVPIHRQSPIRK